MNKQSPEISLPDEVGMENEPNHPVLTKADRERREKMISAELNSKETLEVIKSFSEENRDKIVGEALYYLTLFPENTSLEKYLKELKDNEHLAKWGDSLKFQQKKIELLIVSATEALGLKDPESPEAKEKIYEYFVKKHYAEGYFFHSFNGVFDGSVREKGLDPKTRQWDWEELNHLRAICSRAGESRILGWGDLNCQGKVSIADYTDNLYRYGIASPEWFAQFTAEGRHIPVEMPYDKKAYYKRDYPAAKKNVTMMCDRLMSRQEADIKARKAYPNITAEERDYVMSFFEKYWQILAAENSGPKCALIRRSAIDRDTPHAKTYREHCEFAKELNFDDYSLEEAVYLLTAPSEHDTQIEEPISPENILIVDLPEYRKVHPDNN